MKLNKTGHGFNRGYNMKYISTLIAVSDMEKSKKFYEDVLGLHITEDFGENVTLNNGISLQTIKTWKEFIKKEEVAFQNNVCELYFEEDNIDSFVEHLKKFDIEYIHTLIEHSWGQRGIRFYDLDKHMIEVSESLGAVVERFLSEGLSIEEIAIRMDILPKYVEAYKKEYDRK